MSEEQLHKQSRQPVLKEEPTGNFPVNGRRRLLKGTVAIPVIMTLHSGAALALTSNRVGATTDPNSAATDADGNLLCISPDSDGDISTIPIDVGTHPSATVRPTLTDLQAQADACHNGTNAAPGFLVSATAWNSIKPLVGTITTL